MKRNILSVAAFAAFILLMVGSLLGVRLPENVSVRSVGDMHISPTTNGISIYQAFAGRYYTISPFDDFIFNDKNEYFALITQEEIKNADYQSNLRTTKLGDIIDSIKSYLNITEPQITFWSKNKKIAYSTEIDSKQISLFREISGDKFVKNKPYQALTISYYESDFLFDIQQKTYTFATDEDLSLFNDFYSLQIAPLDEGSSSLKEVKGNLLVISSRDLSSFIVIKATDRQKIFINSDTKKIELRSESDLKGEVISDRTNIQIVDSAQELKKLLEK